jgi:hypothetical protein
VPLNHRVRRSGLYTSPHLVAVRERIRINSVPLSEEQFSSFFFDVWDRLEKNQEVCTDRTSPFFLADSSRPQRALESTSLKPAYFRMVTLVAFHAFLSLGVCVLLFFRPHGSLTFPTGGCYHPGSRCGRHVRQYKHCAQADSHRHYRLGS